MQTKFTWNRLPLLLEWGRRETEGNWQDRVFVFSKYPNQLPMDYRSFCAPFVFTCVLLLFITSVGLEHISAKLLPLMDSISSPIWEMNDYGYGQGKLKRWEKNLFQYLFFSDEYLMNFSRSENGRWEICDTVTVLYIAQKGNPCNRAPCFDAF